MILLFGASDRYLPPSKYTPLMTRAFIITRDLLDNKSVIMQMEVDEVSASGDVQGTKKEEKEKASKSKSSKAPAGPMFTLKKWNAVAMWQWDVECDTCAICRVQVMGEFGFM